MAAMRLPEFSRHIICLACHPYNEFHHHELALTSITTASSSQQTFQKAWTHCCEYFTFHFISCWLI